MPDAYLIIFCVVVVAAVLTYLIPAGSFELQELPIESRDGSVAVRTVLDPDSFQLARNADGSLYYANVSLFSGEAHLGAERIHRFPADANGNLGLFNFAFEGITSGNKYGTAVGIIAFILVIGGSFGIILKTGAIEAGISAVIRYLQSAELVLVPVLFVIFSLGGAIFGMSEEAIAFTMLLVPLMVSLGFDSLTAVLVVYGGTQIGFATSWMNPFGVAIAQGLAGLQPLSGAPFRIGMWAVFTVIMALAALFYGRHIKRHPERSLCYHSDRHFRENLQDKNGEEVELRWGHLAVLSILGLGIAWVVYGVVVYQYFIPEIASQFFIIGLLSGAVGVLAGLNHMTPNDIAKSFRQGASDLLGAALIVGLAKGIILILGGDDPSTPSVLNTILAWMGDRIEPLHESVSAAAMLVFQSGLNFFVPSGSGQAALTVPLMAPLADIAGLPRQVAVLAFQLGDGLTNLIIPTSAALMGCLAVARLDFLVWLRFMWRFQLVLIAMAFATVLIAVAIDFT